MSASALSISAAAPAKRGSLAGASPQRGIPSVGRSSLFRAPVEDHFALAWTTAVSSLILAVGILGCFQPDILLEITLGGDSGRASGDDVVDATMAELSMMEQQAVAVQETVMRPEIEPVEIPLEPPVVSDLPELIPALTDEDVFSVPSAPPIEKALTPVDPVPKPEVKKPAPSAPTRTRSSTSETTTRSTGSSGGSTSGSGSGTGSSSTGSGGKGSFPQPSYPSYARSRGMEGTVTVTIYVASDGSVSSTKVSGSSGHTTLDQHAASWVRRNWKFPAGAAKTFRVPIVFRLR